MAELVQDALAESGIKDQVLAAGQFNGSGSRIELEGNRLPVTHSKDVIDILAG